ncbi:tetratricopeptide repeat protein [Pseudomonadota bacterium]|nr:tetratricopeptide repeat protein [Pseudomonadota bacterium]
MSKVNIDYLLIKANNYEQEGAFNSAEELYSKILKKFPNNPLAKSKLEKIKIDLIENFNSELLLAYNKGDFQKVAEKSAKLTKQFSDKINFWNLLGCSNIQLGFYEKAYAAFSSANKLLPNNFNIINNLAFTLQEQGKLELAIQFYEKVLLLKPDYVEVYNAISEILKRQGKFIQAVNVCKKAISINPNFLNSYNIIGSILIDQGNIDEAIRYFKKAIQIDPEQADVNYNLGVAYQCKKMFKESEFFYKKAIDFNSNLIGSFINLGYILHEQGYIERSIEYYRKAINLNPNFHETYYNLGILFFEEHMVDKAIICFNKCINLKPYHKKALYMLNHSLKNKIPTIELDVLYKNIIQMIELENITSPSDISKAVVSLVKTKPNIRTILNKNHDKNYEKEIKILSNEKLLMKFMCVGVIPDIEIETKIMELRSSILLNIEKTSSDNETLIFQESLAFHCYLNEFIYNIKSKETKALKNLKKTLEIEISKGKISINKILCLASYVPLSNLLGTKKVKFINRFDKIKKFLIDDQITEKKLLSEIPILKKINNSVSIKVRKQYEENPYPRWNSLDLNKDDTVLISDFIKKRQLKVYDEKIKKIKNPKVLIAGCGTGKQSIQAASYYKNSDILAIDISLKSLSYAKRKSQELGYDNIKYIQADILDLENINEKFDIIECTGVLHHMDDPIAGWKVLSNILKVGGLMKIGLYSKFARQDITKIRNEIKQLKINNDVSAIKKFRSEIIDSIKPHHINIKNSDDFYSMSNLRDLLFHIHESNFKLSEISKHLNDLNLSFSGFEGCPMIKEFKSENSASEDLYDLKKWDQFEKKNKQTFAGMYQFWCQKL